MSDADTETVEVPVEAARVAERELGILIEETEPSDENGQPMTPLARVRQRLVDELPYDVTVEAAGVVDAVAEETGAEDAPIDPLQDDIFRAKQAFDVVLEVDDDE